MKNLKELSNKLIQKIGTFTETFIQLISYENSTTELTYIENPNDTKLKQLKDEETYYDKLFETYKRCKIVSENGQELEKLIETFLKNVSNEILRCTEKSEIIGNQLNETLENLKNKEKRVKGFKYNREADEMNNMYLCETELLMKREKKKNKKELKKKIKRKLKKKNLKNE